MVGYRYYLDILHIQDSCGVAVEIEERRGMIRITLGEMLRRFRMEKGLEAKQVCEGLCSTAMMSSFEKGERVPDTLLFEYMMERMGVSPELFSMMISKEELAYYEWRNQVRETITYGEWEKLEQLLTSSIVWEKYCSNDIEQQFFLYVSAICCGINKKYHEAGTMLEKAASKTIPNMYGTGYLPTRYDRGSAENNMRESN